MTASDWVSEYQRRWPKGLVVYPQDGDLPLPRSTTSFLGEVGLPAPKLDGLSADEAVARVRERYELIDPRSTEEGTPWRPKLDDVWESLFESGL